MMKPNTMQNELDKLTQRLKENSNETEFHEALKNIYNELFQALDESLITDNLCRWHMKFMRDKDPILDRYIKVIDSDPSHDKDKDELYQTLKADYIPSEDEKKAFEDFCNKIKIIKKNKDLFHALINSDEFIKIYNHFIDKNKM